MPRYHGPKEQLDAARSPDTDADVLAVLAESTYDFVQTAVAENPNTAPFTLAELVPLKLNSTSSHYLAVALAGNKQTPDYALSRLAERVLPYLHNERGQERCFEVGVGLCCHPETPFEAIATLLAPENSATEFRKVVARETRRADVLQLLQTNRSETVRKQAWKTMQTIESDQSGC